LDAVFGAMRSESPADSIDRVTFDARELSDGRWMVYADCIPLVHAAAHDRLPLVVESVLTHYAAQHSTSCAVFHAGVVIRNGKGILLPGERGSGKSTTTLWLAQQGATYYSDDHAFVRYADHRLVPFPKAVTLKEGSFPLFEETRTLSDAIRGPVRYVLPPSAVRDVSATSSIDAIIFPQYDATVSVESRRVDPPVAALALVQQCFGGMEGGESKLRVLKELSSLPAWLVRYSDLRAFESTVQSLLGDA